MSGYGELWATRTSYTLHGEPDCCDFPGNPVKRTQVKDHARLRYFDSVLFNLCPTARRALTEKGSRDG